jgi:chromosomal replication initiation ATPase DnaA
MTDIRETIAAVRADIDRAEQGMRTLRDMLDEIENNLPPLLHKLPVFGRISQILHEAAAEFGVTAYEIVGRSRDEVLVLIRDEIALRAVEEGFSCARIGKVLQRDGSSIRDAAKRCKLRHQQEAAHDRAD